ncbi:MAG: hypothetical protein V1913_05190 [Fibrobacterota bacterium]
MKNILLIAALLVSRALCQSTLLSLTPRQDETGSTRFLLFDQNPETYYTNRTDTAFSVLFYNTVAGAACADFIRTMVDGPRIHQETLPFPVLTLSFPLAENATAELLPFRVSYAVTLRRPGYKKVWERRFSGSSANRPLAPEKMALYRGKNYENLFLTFPTSTQNVLVRVEKGKVAVEQYGTGALLSREAYGPDSKFVDEIAFSGCRTDSAASEGITLLDFSVGRKTVVTYTFITNGLKIRFAKG